MNYDTSIHINPDANAWAKFFMQTMKENPNIVLDEALMVGWFANAMMAMHDFLKGGGPINGDHAEHILASGAAPADAEDMKIYKAISDNYFNSLAAPVSHPKPEAPQQAEPKEQT